MTYRGWDWDGARSKTSYERAYDVSQRALETALRENRVRGECLEIAMGALEWYAALLSVDRYKARMTLEQIRARLAEPEEETK